MRRRWYVAGALAGAAVAALAAVSAAGWYLTRPAPAVTGMPPAALDAQTLHFGSASGQRLSAWFVPGVRGRGAVLLLHPLRGNKRSMLGRASFLKQAGHALLIVDLQAHGESGGTAMTFGAREALDVAAATAQLQALAPGEKLGVIGTSLGAAAFVLSDLHPEYHAAVLEALYPTIEDAVVDRLRIRLGAAGELLAPLLIAQIRPRLGIDPEVLRPLDRIAALRAPLLLIHGTEDRHTRFVAAQRLYAAAAAPKSMYAVQGAAHVDLHAYAPREYERRVGEHFARHLSAGND